MWITEDNTFNDIRERSYLQWLDEMEKHPDLAVRDGVRLARDYMEHLKRENEKLKESNELKSRFLKQLKQEKTKKNK